MDPTANAQLQCVQLFDWVRCEPKLWSNLYAFFLDVSLGEQTPEWAAKLSRKPGRVEERMLDLASISWSAFRQPTPRSWFAILSRDLSCLPHLATSVRRILAELPEVKTGLIETQRRILELVSLGFDTPRKVMSHHSWYDGTAVLGYWERGRLLCELALCTKPALSGMNGERFTLELHADKDRLAAFWKSTLTFTPFGAALSLGRENSARHNSIDRWWGGTRITNADLWRWNSATSELVEPD